MKKRKNKEKIRIISVLLITLAIMMGGISIAGADEIATKKEPDVQSSEEKVVINASVLHYKVNQMGYDLTEGVTVTDEKGVDHTSEYEIYLAKSEEEEPNSVITQKAGTYFVTIGARKPDSQKEYTAVRKVEVVEGYYLYAPDIEIETATTQYDLLKGAELRNPIDNSVVQDVSFSVNEIDKEALRKSAMSSDEVADFIDTMEKAGEEPAAAMEVSTLEEGGDAAQSNPPLKAGAYSYVIQAVDEKTGESYSAVRMLNVKTVKKNLAMTFEAGAYKDQLQDIYQEGDIASLVLGNLNDAFFVQYEGATPDGKKVKAATLNGPEIPVPSNYIDYMTRELTHVSYSGNLASYWQQNQLFSPSAWPRITTYAYNSLESPSLAEVLGMKVDYEIALSQCFRTDRTNYVWEYVAPMSRNPVYINSNGNQIKGILYATRTTGQVDSYLVAKNESKFFKGYAYWNMKATKTMKGTYSGYYIEPAYYGKNINLGRANIASVNGDWNHYLNGARTKPLYRNGGEPDVTVTANEGQTITEDELDFENFDGEEIVNNVVTKFYMDNVTPESSMRVDVNGQLLKGADIQEKMPIMQISLENALLNQNGQNERMHYQLREGMWFRLKGFKTTDALKDMTADNLRNRQMKLTITGKNDLIFEGAEDPASPDMLYAMVENTSGKTTNVTLQTKAGSADIGTPKLFEVTNDGSDYDFVVDAAKGTSIDAFNLTAKKTGTTSDNAANSIRMGGGGILRFTNETYAPDQGSYYARASAQTVELDSDITVLKSEKEDSGVEESVSLNITKAFLHNGYHLAAGVSQAAAPKDGEYFAAGYQFKLDPTDFTVNTDNHNGVWTNDGSWFMANKDTNTSRIVFRQDEVIGKTPIEVTHGAVTKRFATYKKALDYIDAQADTEYTVKNLRSMDFTTDDLAALKAMKQTGRKITFTGADTGAGAVTYGTCYHIRFREPVVEMPAGYEITWNQPVKYDQGGREATTGTINIEFVKNGGHLSFGDKFDTVDVRRELGTNTGTYGDVERIAVVYGGAYSGGCALNSEISIYAGRFAAVYGGNKKGSHTGNAVISVDASVSGESGLVIRLLDGASAEESAKPGNRTADMSITGPQTITNLYNYDKLTINNTGKLTIPKGGADKEANINSSKASGYAGHTIMCDDGALYLLNNNGVRRLGRLIRSDNASTKSHPQLRLARAVTVDGHNPSDKQNPYLVQLTDKDPFGINTWKRNCRIQVSYYDTSDPEIEGDIIFNLTGVEDKAGTKQKYITAKTLESGFTTYKPVADVTESTIKLGTASVETVIDVTVPLKVGVVAVKNAAGNEQLLAPDCYVCNNGDTRVKAVIDGFTTNEGQNLNLSLIDQDTGDIEKDKLSLYLKPLEIMKDEAGTPWNTFQRINVLNLKANPLELGILEPFGDAGQNDYLGFTFGAHYDPVNIVYPDDADKNAELKNVMTYHFEQVGD